MKSKKLHYWDELTPGGLYLYQHEHIVIVLEKKFFPSQDAFKICCLMSNGKKDVGLYYPNQLFLFKEIIE